MTAICITLPVRGYVYMEKLAVTGVTLILLIVFFQCVDFICIFLIHNPFACYDIPYSASDRLVSSLAKLKGEEAIRR